MPQIHDIRSIIQYNAISFKFHIMNLHTMSLNAMNDPNEMINDATY